MRRLREAVMRECKVSMVIREYMRLECLFWKGICLWQTRFFTTNKFICLFGSVYSNTIYGHASGYRFWAGNRPLSSYCLNKMSVAGWRSYTRCPNLKSTYHIRMWKLLNQPIREDYQEKVSKKIDSRESRNWNIEVRWQNLRDCMKRWWSSGRYVKGKEALGESATNGGMKYKML